jgi:hypothetical protein
MAARRDNSDLVVRYTAGTTPRVVAVGEIDDIFNDEQERQEHARTHGRLYVPGLGRNFAMVQLYAFSHSVLIPEGHEATVTFPADASILAVAAQGAANVADTLKFSVRGLPQLKLATWHLTQLWPEPYVIHNDLPVHLRGSKGILMDKGDELTIEALAGTGLVVVLFGVCKEPVR